MTKEKVMNHSNKCLLKLYVTYFQNLEKNWLLPPSPPKKKKILFLLDNQIKSILMIAKRMLLQDCMFTYSI